MGAIKLGVAAAAGYTLGGRLGLAAITAAVDTPELDTQRGAIWGGRIITFLGLVYVMGKVSQ